MNITFDIGGTNVRAGLFSDEGKLIKKLMNSTPKTYSEGLPLIVHMIGELQNDASNMEGIAIATCGVLDRKAGSILINPNNHGWDGALLRDDVIRATNIRTVIENDAMTAGLGEAHFGAGKGKHIMAFLTIGTGIGGARIVDGNIDTNTWGFEPGSQIIQVHEAEKIIDTRQYGFWEAYASGTAFEKRYGMSASVCTDEKNWKEYATYLGAGINNIICLWSPDVVILGGGVAKSADKFMSYLHTYVERSVRFPHKPPIVVGDLTDEAGLYGGLILLNR